MARMLSKEETEKLEGMKRFSCADCPLKSACSVAHKGEYMTEDVKFGCDVTSKYPWEVVYGYGRDSKYGRSAVNWEHGWRRHVNFDEFYGGAVVD